MHPGHRLALAAFIMAAVTIIGLAATAPGTGGQEAGFDAISIDMDISGNSATSLGARQECREALPGASITVDVTATNISPSTPMLAYTYTLEFPGPTITVTGQEPLLIGANTGSQPFNASDPLPQFDEDFTAAGADLAPNPAAHESGSGVLDRLTLEVSTDAAPAVYSLRITNAAIVDPENQPYPPRTTNNARLAIGVSCAATTPEPPLTATVTPADGATNPPGATSSPSLISGTPVQGQDPGSGTPPAVEGSPGLRSPLPDGSGSATSSASPDGAGDGPDDSDGSGGSGSSVALIVVLVLLAGGAIAAGGWFAYRRYSAR